MVVTTAENDIKERLSIAYVTAVAARAGCEVAERKVDRMAIDVTISAIRGTPAKIDIQLKATSIQAVGDPIPFDLEVASYDLLRSTVITSPQLLVVLMLPDDPEEWLTADADAMAFRRCAHWVNLYGAPPSQNIGTQRVYLPRNQMFHPDVLRDLISRVHNNALQNQTGL